MIELLLISTKGERHFEDFLCEQNILTIEPNLCQLHLFSKLRTENNLFML